MINQIPQAKPETSMEKSDAQLALHGLTEYKTVKVPLPENCDLPFTVLPRDDSTPIPSVRKAQYLNKPVQFTIDKGYCAIIELPEARTSLGRRLLLHRQRIIESGVKLLDWDEIISETRERRGD